MNVGEVFADQTTRALIDRAPLMRLAYTAPDGSPRVIPTSYLKRDAALIMYTIPISAEVTALRADPRVAVTIDIGGMPPCALLVRGTCAIEIVDGIPDGYLEASRRTMDEAAFDSGRPVYGRCMTRWPSSPSRQPGRSYWTSSAPHRRRSSASPARQRHELTQGVRRSTATASLTQARPTTSIATTRGSNLGSTRAHSR